MKKTVKILALLLVATLTLAALVACGPSTNPEKTKKVLEEKGYTVTVTTDQEEFASAYKVYGLENGDIKASMYATNGKEAPDEVHVNIIYCKSASVARKLWNNSTFINTLQGSRGIDGSIIWHGMSQGWDDSLK